MMNSYTYGIFKAACKSQITVPFGKLPVIQRILFCLCYSILGSVTDTQVRQAQVIVDLSALWRVNLVSMLTHSVFSSRLFWRPWFCFYSDSPGNPSVKHCTDIFHSLYHTSVVSFQCKMQLCHCKSMSKIHGANLIINFSL
jgi:hypothetical protein